MTSPISPSTGQPVNFNTNVNRAKTKRWVEAKSYTYDGDDWGDGDEYDDEYNEPAPASASGQSQKIPPSIHMQNPNGNLNQTHAGQRYGELHQRILPQSAHRSATNPAPTHNKGQPSFDLGDERRAFSTDTDTFDAPHAAAQRGPISPVDQSPRGETHDPRMSPQRGPPHLAGLQQAHGPLMEQEQFQRAPELSDQMPTSRSDSKTDSCLGRMPEQGRRSPSGRRPSHGNVYVRKDSPSRAVPSPLSAAGQSSRDGSPATSFPPRKSSLSQHTKPSEFGQNPISQEQHAESEPSLESPAEPKALPFIRPADIYKRVAEAKERERRASEESSRSSVDDRESQKRLKPALDPVVERRSQYATENLTEEAGSATKSVHSGKLSDTVGDDNAAHETVEAESLPTRTPSQPVNLSTLNPETGGSHETTIEGEPDADTSRSTDDVGQQPQGASALRHNPSAGFTSIVHQAFDDSQTKVPPTPSSTGGNSIVRSNSASASDISPIIERASGDSRGRPMSSSTITPTTSQDLALQGSDPLPPAIRPGFRRESRTPSSGNSPARRPISIATSDAAREEVGIISATTPTQGNIQANTQSPVPRAESPTKGTVRDLAGKFESRSPSSSPVRGTAFVAEALRPPNQRLESFRPSLPGGWNSYTTSTGTASPARGSTPVESTDSLLREPAAAVDPQREDMPMAGPPRPREEGYDTSGKAFEALAAAGSALSGAFGAVTGMHRDDASENETSPEASTRGGTPVRERPGGLSPVQEALSVASSAPPTPSAKDAPHERRDLQLGYFPSPLRASKSSETPTPMRPPMLPALSTDNSPQDTENDRLRKEIVRSLTPKSATADPQPFAGDESGYLPKHTSPSSTTLPEMASTKISGEDLRHYDQAAGEDVALDNDGSKLAQDANKLFPSERAGQAEDQSVRNTGSTGKPPVLQNRFSWETSTENVGTLSNPTDTTAATISHSQASDPVESPQTIRAATEPATPDAPLPTRFSEENIDQRPQDRPTIMTVEKSNENLRRDFSPVAQSVDRPRTSADALSESNPLTPHRPLPDHADQSSVSAFPFEHSQGSPAQTSLPITVGENISFREILGMNTVQERIRAYAGASQLLAKQSSGLVDWVQVTGWQHPEHHDLLNRNGRVLGHQANTPQSHKASASRSKFPRVGGSFGGGGGQQAPADSHDASRTSFGSPSGGKMTSQQVQEEGKKLLQSAGKFGGKAGGAAKGLFAKGKNKFRASSGGGDKALPSSRRASQPMVDVENIQHSSGTAATAPQISPILSGADSIDTWSLSYAPSESASKVTLGDKAPAAGEHALEQPKYANLGPPGYSDHAIDTNSPSRSLSAPSPQVSAGPGSTNQDGIPSGSVSEVSRSDKKSQNRSPTGSGPQQSSLRRAASGAEPPRRHSPASKSPQQSRLSSPHVVDETVPCSDKRRLVDTYGDEIPGPRQTASSGSSYSQPAGDVPLARTSSNGTPPTEQKKDDHESPGHDLKYQRSVVSTLPSPSPGPPTSHHNGLSTTTAQQNASFAQENIDEKGPKPLASVPAASPPYEDITPPYSAAIDSKAAEAATERSQETSRDRRQSLPAYQSTVQGENPRLPFQPSAIIPVADLTARKREERGRPPSRPFSFMDTNQEDILHRYSPSNQHISGGDSSLSKEQGLDVKGTGDSPYSRSIPRPFNDVDLSQHPAFRGLTDNPLPSQARDYIPPQRSDKPSSLLTAQVQPEQQYRIPGPYGKQFRSPKSILSSQNAEQPSGQWQHSSGPLAEGEEPADHHAPSRHSHQSSDVAALPRLSTTEYSLPGVGPPPLPGPSTPTPKFRGTAAKLFRPRSKSRPRPTNDGDSDGQEHYRKEAKKKERHGGMFRPRSRQEAESTSNRHDSTVADLGVSQNGFRFRQSPLKVQSEARPKAQERKSPKKLQRASTSNSASQAQDKKKGGFLRLSKLLGKYGKEGPPPEKRKAVQRAASLQSTSSPPLLRPSAPASSVPHGEQQAQWRERDHTANSFQGQTPAVGGYFAPTSQPTRPSEYQSQPMPRDPDAFIGGHRLSGQRAAEQARHLENIAAWRNQTHADEPCVLSTQQLDHGQTPAPRAASQRSPPDLRIDTSGHLNANRCGQPLHLAAANSNQGSTNMHRGDRPSEPGPATTNPIHTHTHSKSNSNSSSNPQRHSPYTDRTSQHSPYGYGTARGLRKDNLSHAIDLHKRSRSPRNGRPDSYDDSQEDGLINAQDPANRLGIFSQTHRSRPQRLRRSSAQEDQDDDDNDGQEKPWKIDLPIADDDDPQKTAQRMPLSAAPGNANTRAAAGPPPLFPPVELPGSNPTDSDEEIVMSSTAYPGQEWVPTDMHGYGHWEDLSHY